MSDDAGLDFLGVREEAYDLSFTSATSLDPRLRAMVQTVRSVEYRRLVEDLPGTMSLREIGAYGNGWPEIVANKAPVDSIEKVRQTALIHHQRK